MRRTFAASVLFTMLAATPALGADPISSVPALDLQAAALASVLSAAAAPASDPDGAADAAQVKPDFSAGIEARLRRPLALPALYVASASLQGYDAYSTLSALKHGAVEANPVMKGIVKSPVAFVALKAGVAATSIMAAERLWKSGNRIGAIGVMVASNVAMGLVAANNARVLSGLE